ncbi:MAG: RHS repeat protein [Alphaproteobacteria bacterium]|nr:RHS repeat protein [Alphaproteobacteria bacterium]
MTAPAVSTVVTPDGTFTYSYGSNNNLTQVTKPDTKTRIYHYENATFVNALTGITDEMGVRISTWGYDAQGRANASSHAGGGDDFAITYNTDETTTVTNPLGKSTTYTYTIINGLRKITKIDQAASANTPAATAFNTYTSDGYLASTTDFKGNVTNYTYDANGLETSRKLKPLVSPKSARSRQLGYPVYDYGCDHGAGQNDRLPPMTPMDDRPPSQ